MLSNCIIAAFRLWWRFRDNGAELVMIKTQRHYWLIEMPHAFVRFADGYEVEFVPLKDLGKFPPPLFRGTWRMRAT